MFPLSLSRTTFTLFTSLAPNSIFTWAQLEQKFHEYLYSSDTELRLSHLTIIKQKHNERHVFYDVIQVLQRALDCGSRPKESRGFPKSINKPRNECHVNMVEYSSESSDDKEADMCVAEWNWGPKSKSFVCSSLKPNSKS
jgi:hypothetical protein